MSVDTPNRWAGRVAEIKRLHAAFLGLPQGVQCAFVELSKQMTASGYDMRQVNRVRAVLVDQARGAAPVEGDE